MKWADVDTTCCGVAAATSIVGDRWIPLILRDVFFGVHRFDDLLTHTGVSTAVLSDRLRRLVDHGVLAKVRYQSEGYRHRYEYQLTERGLGLLFVQLALADFGYEHLVDADKRLVEFVDRSTGQRVRLGLVREDGTVIGAGSLGMEINEAIASKR